MDEKYIEAYAKLDSKASPTFIEPKGYVFVGSSRNRLHFSNMPTYDQIHSFSGKLAEHLSYELAMEKEDSLVVLLAAQKKNNKIK
jgi:tRNA wybutosine-synthesizing protein 1